MLKKKKSLTKRNLSILQKISIWLIVNIHQKRISPRLNEKGTKCRFYPTCSNYGIMAIKKYGFFHGWILAIKRIFRCRSNNYNSCVDYP